MDSHSTADIKVSGGGSGVGIQSIGEVTAYIGMSSRELKPEEITKYPNLQIIRIAMTVLRSSSTRPTP